jgi:hypothetical protein
MVARFAFGTPAFARVLAVAALGLTACGSYVKVEVEGDPASAPAWVRAPDLHDRTIAAVETAAIVWNEGALPERLVVRYVFAIPGRHGDTSHHGVTRWDDETVIRVSWSGHACLESSSLSHEAGHALRIEDQHEDANWCSAEFWNQMITALSVSLPATEPDPEGCAMELAYQVRRLNLDQAYCGGERRE